MESVDHAEPHGSEQLYSGRAGDRIAEAGSGSFAALIALVRTIAQIAPGRFALTIALIAMFSLTEGAGVAMLFPTLQLAGYNLESQGKVGHYAHVVGNAFTAAGLNPTLPLMLSLYILVIAARSLIDRYRNVCDAQVHRRVEDVMRRRLYRAISEANWQFITRSRLSDFNHALTAEMDRITTAASFLTALAANLVMGVLYVGVALALSAPMTLTIILLGALMTLALSRRTRGLEELGAALSRQTSLIYAAASDHLQGLKTAKTYDAVTRDFELFSNVSRRIADTYIKVEREQATMSSWFELGSAMALGVVLLAALKLFAAPPAMILILILLFARLMPRFQSSHQYYRTIINALPSFANVCAMERRCRAAAEAPGSPGHKLSLTNQIRLNRVSFTYGAGVRPALSAVDLTIPAGRITAAVGPSGAGKSTIADIVMGLLEPTEGEVMVDDARLNSTARRGWRTQLGYVGPETALFNLSIRENLLWARPDATESELKEALKASSADDFTRALPDGLDTIVGDRGALFSQGECQRLAIARALLRRPALLVLDEATNNLDYHNEKRVLGAIAKLRPETTVLVITHRLSTIRWADLIYVVEDGRIVESGGWNELTAKRSGRFHALCESQRLVA